MCDATVDWGGKVKLAFNAMKTVLIIFSSRRSISLDNLSLSINNQHVKRSSQCTYLGMIFDELLCWRAHVAAKCASVKKIVRKKTGFKSTSTVASLVLANILPLDLEVQSRIGYRALTHGTDNLTPSANFLIKKVAEASIANVAPDTSNRTKEVKNQMREYFPRVWDSEWKSRFITRI